MSGFSSGSGNATKIQGVPVAATAPTVGQTLDFGGTSWAPGNVAVGTNANQIQGVAVSATPPTANQSIVYNGTSYVPTTTVTSGAVLGDAYYDPAVAATYSSTSTALTAVDTTNLRATFVAPLDGMVWVVYGGFVTPGAGAINPMLAVMNGATVLGVCLCSALEGGTFLGSVKVTGLTPGNTYHFDLALATVSNGVSVSLHAGGGDNVNGFGTAFVEVRG